MLRTFLRLFLALHAVVGAFGSSTSAMQYHKREMGNGHFIIFMYGAIVPGDTRQLLKVINHTPSGDIFGFALHSPGGDIDEAYRLALYIRSVHGLTIIGDRNICAAACFLPFSVGRIKLVHPESKIIVHGTGSADGLDNVAALNATNKIAGYARKLGVPETIIRKMVMQAPGEVEPLSRADLVSMGAEFPADAGR